MSAKLPPLPAVKSEETLFMVRYLPEQIPTPPALTGLTSQDVLGTKWKQILLPVSLGRVAVSQFPSFNSLVGN